MKEPSFQILSKLKTKEMKCALVELCKLDRAISLPIRTRACLRLLSYEEELARARAFTRAISIIKLLSY